MISRASRSAFSTCPLTLEIPLVCPRFDSLLATYSPEQLGALGVRRVAPSFRVLALALPPG